MRGRRIVSKKISANALMSLKNALSKIYWYKRDLRSFMSYSIKNNAIVSTVDWEGNSKFEVVSELVDRMERRPDIYFDDLIELIHSVCDFSDYSHFSRLPDGAQKRAEAREAVNALQRSCGDFFEQEKEKQQAEERKKVFEEHRRHTLDYNKKIDEFKDSFYQILKEENSQKRGYLLEKFLGDLFAFFDLSPRSSFKIQGEQIDGAFTHDNTDYLIEAKWQKNLVEKQDIDIFEAKVSRKLKTTLGLFISVNGFNLSATSITGSGKSIILMDGQDLMQVLENRISLTDLILLKRRHAAETGESMYHVNV